MKNKTKFQKLFKACKACKHSKPTVEFYGQRCAAGKRGYKSDRIYTSSECKICFRARTRRNGTAYRRNNRDKCRKGVARANRRVREEVISKYGNLCRCCGETNSLFLSIDHINNDGASRRDEQGTGWGLCYWIKRNNYPDDFQILCMNCNTGKARNKGVCPHVTRISQIDQVQQVSTPS